MKDLLLKSVKYDRYHVMLKDAGFSDTTIGVIKVSGSSLIFPSEGEKNVYDSDPMYPYAYF